ncbi:uncharacterized protein PAE49_015937 [Odontesthes bonariensis]|uniref:uncharacterized protein LOC142398238 n=1 Tax=Odontesthes bonariensis TaxID=219752 RepID=UPI003F58A048
MAALVLLVIIALLDSLTAQGPGRVFVKSGTDLLLDANTTVRISKVTDFIWKFGSDNNVVKHRLPDIVFLDETYNGRANFSTHNYSLLIKNVQHHDSGSYSAILSGRKDQTVAKYNVRVQDPVSGAQLTVTPITNLSTSCNLTATCTAQDSNITATIQCNEQNCSLVKDPSLKITSNSASVDVYLQKHHIICNHSNGVSWELKKSKIVSYCETKSEIIPSFSAATSIGVGVGAACILAAVIFSIVCIGIKCKNRRSKRSEDIDPDKNEHEEYASGLSPTSIYSLVQTHSGPVNSVETNDSPQPETLYAQVNLANKSRPPTSNS